MDLDFSEQQELLSKSAKGFFAEKWDSRMVREMEEDEKGFSPGLWREMAELGWLGLTLPEEHGGAGGSMLDVVVLCEEMGRVLYASPYLATVVLCGGLISQAGAAEQKRNWLPKIAHGEAVGAFALAEANGVWQSGGVRMTARSNGSGFVLDGVKLFVEYGAQADFVVVAARTDDPTYDGKGITTFIVDAKSAGLRYSPLSTLAGDKQAEVVFENVEVPDENRLGELHQGWLSVERAVQRGIVAKCAQMIGGCDKVIEMAVDYAKVRVQFGQPIGRFQVIQHYLADIATEIVGAKALLYEAAWTIDGGLPAARITAMAKAFIGDTYAHVTAVGHQIHGGIGFTEDSDMGLYSSRAKAAQLTMGTAESWEEIVAQELDL